MTESLLIGLLLVIGVALVTIVLFVAARLVTATRQERVMAQRAEASERFSEQVIASLTSGLLVVDENRKVQTLNPAGKRMLGLAGRAEGHSMDGVLGNAAPLAAVVEECLRSSRPVLRRSLQTGLPGGGTAHLGVTVSPIHGHAAQNGAICLFSDLSDVVQLEEQLRFKDSLARLGELTAGIAHEFRNGLATIHGYSRLLDPEKLPPEYRPYVQGIRDETEALRQVVTNFLNFAKPAELTLSPVALKAIADRAAEEVRSEVSSRGGEVQVTGEFHTVQGDEVLLRQAFSNLVRNGLEACTDASVPPRIHIHGAVDRSQGVQQMTVSDNGPGVDANVLARMFRPFFTTKARGTGLGLALVQKIIVTHNGRVTVTNNDGGGARITVTLPLGSP